MIQELMSNASGGFKAQIQLQSICQKAIDDHKNKKKNANRKTKTTDKLYPE